MKKSSRPTAYTLIAAVVVAAGAACTTPSASAPATAAVPHGADADKAAVDGLKETPATTTPAESGACYGHPCGGGGAR